MSAATRFGPYESLSALGAGGIGEVYRARDPRLGRDAFTHDRERLARVRRDAEVLAALNMDVS